jgi:hypothetical protein
LPFCRINFLFDAPKEVIVTIFALIFSIIISTGSLAWGFAQMGFVVFARWILIFGAAWLLMQWGGWRWFSSIGLFFVTLLSAIGLWFGVSPGWFFSGAIFALFAWDMTNFRGHLLLMAKDDNTRGIERRHLGRISLLAFAGLFLASITMFVRVQFTFEWSALLVIVTLLGLGQFIGWFRR